MKLGKGWKLRYWIIGGYVVPVIALIVSAGITTISVANVKSKAEQLRIFSEINDRINLTDIKIQILSRTTRGYLLEANAVSRQNFVQAREDYRVALAELQALIKDPEQAKRLNEAVSVANQLVSTNEELIRLVDTGQTATAIAAWREGSGRIQAETVTDLFNQMQEHEHEAFQAKEIEQAAALENLQFVILTTAGTSMLFSIAMGFWIVSRAARQMNRSANMIASSSSEIAASVEQQERTTHQQVLSVNETTTTMDELGVSSRQSAEQAEAAALGAKQALELAEGGSRAVEQTLSGMETLRVKVDAIAEQILRLSEQTSQIGSISGLVSDLANQTNMLALNAAVEAVRAGEHGRGFAVVSSEIRKLADQSKQSAQKINALVTDIQNAINSTVMVTDEGTKTVEEGVQVAEKTANAFAGVTDAVNNVVLNSQQISLNVQQQAIAIQQVLGAINGLNFAAKETASGISQIKMGTQQLNDAAVSLKTMV